MTSPSDNEIIGAIGRALRQAATSRREPGLDRDGWMFWRPEAKALLSAIEPIITTRTQEAVLRRLLEWASHEGRAHCYDDLIDYCTQNGIALDTFCKDARP